MAAPSSSSTGITGINRIAQAILGDVETAAVRRSELEERAAEIVNEMGGMETINKPKAVMKFYTDIQYKNVGGQHVTAVCMFCQLKLTSTGSTRLLQHMCSCALCPTRLMESFKLLQQNTVEKRKAKIDHMAVVAEENERTMNAMKVQKTLARQQGYKDSFKASEAQAADIAIGKFFYAQGISFNVASPEQDSYYRNMVRAIQAAPTNYIPPNRKALAGPLIDTCSDLLRQEIQARDPEETLAAKFGITYTQDGWESVDKLPLINSAYITANDGGVYLRSVDTSGCTKSSEYVASLMIEDIYTIGCYNVVLVVSDTCAVMSKAWSLVMDEFPWMSAIPCVPHVVSLLLKDIGSFKEVTDLIKDETTIVGW